MYVCKKFKIKGNAMKENNIIKWEKIEKIEENKKIVIFGASSHSNYLLNQIKNKKEKYA